MTPQTWTWDGRRLRELREAAGLSQREVGERIGVHQTMVSHLESGRKSPSVSTAVDLCRVLDCSVDDLLGVAR